MAAYHSLTAFCRIGLCLYKSNSASEGFPCPCARPPFRADHVGRFLRPKAHLDARGDDPNDLPRLYAGLINAAIKDRPAGMKVCVHLCRGNFQSAWAASGGYEPVAEVLFNEPAA